MVKTQDLDFWRHEIWDGISRITAILFPDCFKEIKMKKNPKKFPNTSKSEISSNARLISQMLKKCNFIKKNQKKTNQ